MECSGPGSDDRGDRDTRGRRQHDGSQAARQDDVLRHHAEVRRHGVRGAVGVARRVIEGTVQRKNGVDRRLRPCATRARSRAGTSSTRGRRSGTGPQLDGQGQRRRRRDAGARTRRHREGVMTRFRDGVRVRPAEGLSSTPTAALHRDGTMRLATAADEILLIAGPARPQPSRLSDRAAAVARDHPPRNAARGQRRRRRAAVHRGSRVPAGALQRRINGLGGSGAPAARDCGHEFATEVAAVGGR